MRKARTTAVLSLLGAVALTLGSGSQASAAAGATRQICPDHTMCLFWTDDYTGEAEYFYPMKPGCYWFDSRRFSVINNTEQAVVFWKDPSCHHGGEHKRVDGGIMEPLPFGAMAMSPA
ncbi:peptidase inhibitor family I36 protein [Streptomyces roseolus]|uniref:peptidase inhibitor family I36 protein n=1 Tax=Streptomyces roseolus TaxID=67358 RepID=UPI0037AD6615